MDKDKKINFLKVGYKLEINKLQKRVEKLTAKAKEIDIYPTRHFHDSLKPREEKNKLEYKIQKAREEIKVLEKEIEELSNK